jgi:uncharacterized lipoprotein YajG
MRGIEKMRTALKNVFLVGAVLLAAGCSSDKPSTPEPTPSAVNEVADKQAQSGSMEEIISLTETLQDRRSADVRPTFGSASPTKDIRSNSRRSR